MIHVGHEKSIRKEKESINPKFHRTEKEEKLSLDFEMKYSDKISYLTNTFETLYRNAYKTNNLSERIDLLKQSTDAFEKAKKFCYSKGKGGTIYFQDMWELMHNSQNSCFSYLDNIKNSLNEAIEERDIIILGILHIIEEMTVSFKRISIKKFQILQNLMFSV